MSEAGEGRAVWEKGNVWETPDRFFSPAGKRESENEGDEKNLNSSVA